MARAAEKLPGVDAEAMRLVLMLHRSVGMLVYDLESSVHRPRGLSWPGFRVLFALWIAGPLELRRVAELSGMSRAAVSALIKKLERDALVQRHNPDHDRRMVVLSLTGRGEAEIAQGFAAHNQREQVWSAALDTDEQETLVHLLRKLTEGRRPEDVRRRS